MALGALFILFIVLTIVSLLLISLLYIFKNEKYQNMIFYFLCVWSIILAILNVTSLPSNFLGWRLIGCIWALLAIIAIFIKIKNPDKKSLSYLLASASTVLSLLDLFFL